VIKHEKRLPNTQRNARALRKEKASGGRTAERST
jgi:hypothetical protein